jgi:TrmH family RNA methyltransferase
MISKSNIKFVKSLQQKKFRDEHQAFVVEGEKMVLEALKWKADYLTALYYTEAFPIDSISVLPPQSELISEKELHQISSLQTPNKALAVFSKWTEKLVKIPFYLALDNIQDPGNMGTILRLADWYGIDAILCSYQTVDCFNPKVIQATMGAIFRVQVHYVDLMETFKLLQLPVYGALLEGENVYLKKFNPSGILVLGNEGNGISESIQHGIDFPISIPRFGQAESLNVSTAGAILLSEFFRNSFVK